MKKTIERGYFSIETDEGTKWAHFSRTFMGQLAEISDQDIVSVGKILENPDADPGDQFDAITLLLHAGVRAYDLENDIEIDYNKYKVGNWLWDAMQEDADVAANLMKALMASLPASKGVQGK